MGEGVIRVSRLDGERVVCAMALRPNAPTFAPGTGGSSLIPSIQSKQTSFSNSSNSTPSPTSSTSQSIPNKVTSRTPAKTKALPRGNQGKRGQGQKKFEKKSRLADEALTVDPVLDTVFDPDFWRVGLMCVSRRCMGLQIDEVKSR